MEAYKRAITNLVVAHARAYDAIKSIRGDAVVGVIHVMAPIQPLEPARDSAAASIADAMVNSFLLDSITKGRAAIPGIGLSLEAPHLAGRLDWLGVNYYTRSVVRAGEAGLPEPVMGYGDGCVPGGVSREGRPCSDVGWEHYPEGLREVVEKALNYSGKVIVTENGVADSRDRLRPRFILDHLRVLEELVEAGVKVLGYLHWALTDNYEWAKGFKARFGLYEVDLATKERIARRSALLLKEIISRGTTKGVMPT